MTSYARQRSASTGYVGSTKLWQYKWSENNNSSQSDTIFKMVCMFALIKTYFQPHFALQHSPHFLVLLYFICLIVFFQMALWMVLKIFIHSVVTLHGKNRQKCIYIYIKKKYYAKQNLQRSSLAPGLEGLRWSFSTTFKHSSENSTNSGSCMAAFIISSLFAAESMERNNCLRWGLRRRPLSSSDWPGEGQKSQD